MSFKNKDKIGYIRCDNRNYEKVREKVARFLRKIFVKVKYENIKNGEIIVIPEYKKYNKIISKRIIAQLNLYIKEHQIDYFAFEENLQFIEKKIISSNILNGKFLMKEIILKILEYIFEINKQSINLENVYIFVNKYTKSNIYMIEQLVSKFKTVNIITENLKNYRRLESTLYNEGILITVSNNKRKSARNAKYIINIDFEKESFEKYNINMNSIIINITNELIFFEKTFKGVLVNNFEICINEDYKEYIKEFYGNINSKIYLESILYSGKEYLEKAERLYMEYDAKILALTGVRGTLQKCEFLV